MHQYSYIYTTRLLSEALLGGGSGRGGRATAAEDKGRKRAGAGRGKESAAKSGNAARVPAAVPRRYVACLYYFHYRYTT